MIALAASGAFALPADLANVPGNVPADLIEYIVFPC